MKVGSKRRRQRATIEKERLESLTKAQAIEDKLKNLERLIEENAELKAQQEVGAKAQQTLQAMCESGFVDVNERGEYIPG